MKHKIFVFILFALTLLSCEFRRSVNKDFKTGLATIGSGLSCENVYLTDGDSKINKKSFTYGEKFYLNFENIEGFIKKEGYVFPGMKISVVSQSGDTVLKNDDLYADYPNGMNISPLLLHTNLTVANPIHSNNKYSLHVMIWDKMGEGTFIANMEFNVVPNNHIKIERNAITYDEIYLFSEKDKTSITENTVKFNENIYLLFEGLEGFKVEDGKVFLGLSITAKDSDDKLILNEEDLIGESTMNYSEVKTRIASNFIFTGTHINNPVTCEVAIWDKKSDSKIKATVKLEIN